MKKNQKINFLWVAFVVFYLCQPIFAQSENIENKTRKRYIIQRINPRAPVIDGQFDEAVWQHGPWETDFTQKFPSEGDKPSQDTSFKILYDDNNIYVGIRALDSEPDKIVRRMSRRDHHDGDWVEIILDSYFDHRTGFSFSVSAAGVKTDVFISGDGDNWDDSWDPIWFVKTSVDQNGWAAEMKIPFSQLRFGRKEIHTWGLHVARFLHRKQEISEWNLIPRQSSGWISRFGELAGLAKINPKRPIELLPYGVGKLQRFEKEEGNPFATGKLSDMSGGLDGKIGLTNDFTLDFTINPDFGQVEADPSEVNLTAFETFFQEKRPFFIEGRNILNYNISGGDGPFSQDNLFYSRRIGRFPQYSPDTTDDEYLDMPENTRILAAFKLTGKTRTGLSIGIMESVTVKETAMIDLNGGQRQETVEPLTNYFVLRLQKDINRGNTGIGGIFTATHRDLNLEKNPYLNVLHSAAYSGGLDFFHHWKNKQWFFSLKSVFSQVRGDKEAILEAQESSLRYYQRPDADYVTLDPERTSLSGHGGDINFGKIGGGHWRFVSGVTWRSPGLELNDVGFLRAADRVMEFVWVGYRTIKPVSIFRSVNLNFNQYQGWNFGGERIFNGGNINFFLEFKNYWSLGSGIEVSGKALSNDSLRGGPSLKYPGGWNHWFNIRSDSRKKFFFWMGGSNYWGYLNSTRRARYWWGITYKPINALSLTIHPSYANLEENLQYVDTIELADINRYIFAHLHQKTMDITLRLNYSITPDLSIQFYGQPFISSGRYTNFKHITQSRADNYNQRFYAYNQDEIQYNESDQYYYINEQSGKQFEFENPNFKFLQFRSNLVIRWEYKPGSTLYLVWSQGRTDDYIDNIDFTPVSGIRDLFRIHPHDVFLLKFTYRLKI